MDDTDHFVLGLHGLRSQYGLPEPELDAWGDDLSRVGRRPRCSTSSDGVRTDLPTFPLYR